MWNRWLALLLFLVGLLGTANAQSILTFYSQNFEANNGGYTTTTVNDTAPGTGPWTYGAYGLGGTNGWSCNGGETGNPFEQWLTSPAITIPLSTTPVTLEFDHQYNFEYDGTPWDGGALFMSRNGGPFTQIPLSDFTENGYVRPLQTDFDWGFPEELNGLDVFNASSDGWIHSVAGLVGLAAGDSISLQFRGGWDWGTVWGPPAWSIDNVVLSQPEPLLPEPATLSLLLAGLAGLRACRRRTRRTA